MSDFKFHTDTPTVAALKALFEQLERRLALNRTVPVWIAGGIAVHLYTATRVTTDVDAEFGARLILPSDLAVEIDSRGAAGEPPELLYFDTNFNTSFSLMHEDYQHDAWPLDLGLTHLQTLVLSPVDLAVSKIARWAENDRDDLAALVKLGLTDANAIEQRAIEAMAGYVGSLQMLKLNLRDAIALAQSQKSSAASSGKLRLP
jgi:hypothetical protein